MALIPASARIGSTSKSFDGLVEAKKPDLNIHAEHC
jgi:hypothetical protein